MPNNIHIAIASDRNYLVHAGTLIRSICENHWKQRLFFHLLTMDERVPEDEKLKRFISEISSENVSLQVHCLDENSPLIRSIPDGCAISSRSAFLRFLAPDLVDAEKLLYLDCDTIVLDDLGPLFEMNMGEKTLAAVSDLFSGVRMFSKGFGLQYFNSGVLLINARQWRENDDLKKVISFTAGKFTKIFAGKKQYGDQDILNLLFLGDVMYLHPKYNAVNPLFLRRGSFRGEIFEQAYRNPTILHFAGGAKPWNPWDVHPYSGIYWKYRRMTPWADSDPVDSTLLKKVSYVCKSFKYRFQDIIYPGLDLARRIFGYPSRIVPQGTVEFLIALTAEEPD